MRACGDMEIDCCIRERERLGRDLHDTVAQDLASAQMFAQVLESSLRKRSAPEVETVSQLTACIGQALKRLRGLVHGIVAVEISSAELPGALRDLCSETSRRFSVSCRLSANGSRLACADLVATQIYCIVREALHNAVRHGKSSTVTVCLQTEKSRGLLVISDNGQGLPKRPEHHGGIGMRIMRQRARQAGGRLTVVTKPGQGTTLRCRFPVDLT